MVRIGVVGVGRLGAFHAQTLADHTTVTEVVVTDPLLERGRSCSRRRRRKRRSQRPIDARQH